MKTIIFFVFSFIVNFPGVAQEKDWSSIWRAESNYNFQETRQGLLSGLKNNPETEIFAEIDHSKNAENSGMDLGLTEVIFFGNAEIGTPLMQNQQLAGLDLPLKILIWEEDSGKVFLGYTDMNFIKIRHRLTSRKNLNGIERNLKELTKKVTGNNPKKTGKYKVRYKEGIKNFKSSYSLKETMARLGNAIEETEGLKIAAQIDHAKNAEKKGLGMRPATLFIFGNPKIGTKLIQNEVAAAMALPLKILIWKDDTGAVNLAWDDPGFIQKRFRLNRNREEIDKMTQVLNRLTKEATGVSSE